MTLFSKNVNKKYGPTFNGSLALVDEDSMVVHALTVVVFIMLFMILFPTFILGLLGFITKRISFRCLVISGITIYATRLEI